MEQRKRTFIAAHTAGGNNQLQHDVILEECYVKQIGKML